MPIIASQHSWKDRDHVPSEDWPEDCTVQWGGHGVVLSDRPGGSYGTAFFEAFPPAGGFIRGEGETIALAEAKALARFRRESACQHRWGRDRWTNGGALCRNCGAFQTVFTPIVRLGAWRDPLTAFEIDHIASGYLRPGAETDARSRRYHRRMALKAAVAGIRLPEIPQEPAERGSLFDPPDAYVLACRRAVGERLRDLLRLAPADRGGLSGLFEGMHRRSLERLLEEIEGDGVPAP